jgi:hypothetical protein
VGFNKGFEKVAIVSSLIRKGATKLIGGGIQGAGKIMGAGTGLGGSLAVANQTLGAQQKFKETQNLMKSQQGF